MNMADFSQLRLPCLILVVAITSSAGIYFYSSSFKEKAHQALQQQQSQWTGARARYLASGDEKTLIVQFLPPYRQLEKRGFIGEERRVDWIDALRDAGVRRQLFPIDYNVGIRENYSPAGLETGKFRLRRSSMKLHLLLLHEEDLLALLNGLPKNALPPFMLRDCDIVATSSSNHYLDANCEIDWYTLAGA